MNYWFRLSNGVSSDKRWPSISKRSKQCVGNVLAVWVALLDHASQNAEPGSVDGFDCEDVDILFGYADKTTEAIVEVMKSRGMITDDGYIAGWENIQNSKPAKSSKERVAEHRARKKAEKEQAALLALAGNECNECNVTPLHVTECNDVTTEKKRKDKIRKDSLSPYTPSQEGEEKETLPTSTPIRTEQPSKAHPAYKGFMSVWQVYPVKKGQADAWRSYMRLYEGHVLPEAYFLREKVQQMLQQDSQWQSGYAPEMSRWLDGQRWNDEPFHRMTQEEINEPQWKKDLRAQEAAQRVQPQADVWDGD